MSRTELFDYIKKNNLQAEIKEKFGKAYNSVSTILLEDFVSVVKEAKTVNSKLVTTTVPTNRKELCDFIKSNNLQNYIKEYTGGKNYTIVSTESLHNICDEWFWMQNSTIKGDKTNVNKGINVTSENTKLDKLEKTVRAIAEILNLKTVLKNLD